MGPYSQEQGSLMQPTYKIPYVKALTVEEINRMIEQVNRALLDIYAKANTGVFSGIAITALVAGAAGSAGLLAGTPLINGVGFNGGDNINIDIGVATSTRINGHFLSGDINLVPFDIGFDNFTSSTNISANGYVLVGISGVNYKLPARIS